jgi:DMSO/TMAO reductase YedYZ molybdopterin-dependent catalytic subunit
MSEGQGARRNLEGKISQEGRLPPGQSLTVKFPVLHYGPVPPFDPSMWEFRVWGEVDQVVTWTWDEFLELQRTKVKMDIHCVTRWSKFDTEWEGVSLQTLVQQEIIKVKPSAKFLLQHLRWATANARSRVSAARSRRSNPRKGRAERYLPLERWEVAERFGVHTRG